MPCIFCWVDNYISKDAYIVELNSDTTEYNKRTYDAAYALCEIEHGEPYIPSGTTKEAEAKRHKFVLSQSCVASRYLTRYDGFIFVQAIKEHFQLPFEVPDEDDEVKNYFPDFFMELTEEDVDLALDVWAWCIKEFGAYRIYMESTWTLYNSILSSLDDYPLPRSASLLCLTDAGKRYFHERDSGMAWALEHQYHGKYLCACRQREQAGKRKDHR